MSEDVPVVVPGILSELAAVVLYADGAGRQLSWHRDEREWLVSSDFRRGGYQRQAHAPANASAELRWMYRRLSPSSEDIADAVTIAERFKNSAWCTRCGRGEMRQHAIYPDVWGDAVLACLQLPSPSIVESYGGGGELKHWGYDDACPSVKGGVEYDDGRPYAVYLYGRPMPTAEALDREWCSKCTQRAWNMRLDVISVLKEGADHEPEPSQIRQALSKRLHHHGEGALIRSLLHETRGRTRSELLEEMRREIAWRTEPDSPAD